MKRLTIYILLCWATLLPCYAFAATEPIPEYDMKAVYLYNFAALVTWPEMTAKKIRLCVLGKDSFKGGLEKIASDSAGAVTVSLTYLPNLKSSTTCQILFIDASEHTNADSIFQHLEGKPVLTVTDSPDIFNLGAMIGLFVENKRLTFDINYMQAQHAGLIVSSKLLRVARKVLQ